MNEKIKQLAEQAVEETQLLMIMEYKSFESKLYEKFAELIVRECAEYVDTLLGDAENPHYPDGEMIKEHFGVEL